MLRRKIHFVFSVLSIVLWTIFSTTRAQTVPERQIKIIGLLAPDTVRVQRGQKIPLQVSLLHVGGVKIRVMKDPQLERIETLYVSWICEIVKDGLIYDDWKDFRHFVSPYHRRRTHTRTLKKGKSMSKNFDLQELYPLDSLGTYQVRAVYVQRPFPEIGIIEVPPVYSNWITVIVE